MRELPCALVVLAACGGPGGLPGSMPSGSPGAAGASLGFPGSEGAPVSAPGGGDLIVRSCPARVAAQQLPLRAAHVIAELSGTHYAVAERVPGYTPVLVWLAADGALREHPLARTPIAWSRAGSAVYLIGTQQGRRAFFVEALDLAQEDAPRRIDDVALTGVPVGVLGGFVADARRLLVSQIVHGGGEDGHVVHAIDRVTGRIEVRPQLSFGEASFCDGTGCALVALDHTAKSSFVAWEPHDGGQIERLPMGPYPGYRVERVDVDGGVLMLEGGPDGWTGALVAAPRSGPRLRPLRLTDAPTGACPFDAELPGRWPGVVVCSDDQARWVVLWNAALTAIGAPEPLPRARRRRERYARHPDGVIRVAWEGGAGLMHGPEYQGIREYHEHWSFDGGEASLILREAAGWVERDRTSLVLRDAKGEFSHGYEPALLVRGLRAAVLLSSDGHGEGEPAWLQAVREPCP